MLKLKSGLTLAGLVLGVLVQVAPLEAQATRTWVSGVGDDVNPCSRTAPCKTFAGAISKTAANGEINVLDPGGFGGVTITKSITISSEGFEAGVLVSGTNAIIINAPATANVVLRGLDIEGLGTGLSGIRVLAAGTVTIEDCTINGFVTAGIDVQPTTGVFLFIKDTTVRNNRNTTVGGGILIKPGVGGSVRSSIDNVRSERNLFGLRAENNTETVVRNSSFTGSLLTATAGSGIGVSAVGTTNSQINLENCVVSNNTLHGVQASGTNTFVRLANTTVTNNNGTGINPVSSGQVHTYGDNKVVGNGTNGTFSPGSPTKS